MRSDSAELVLAELLELAPEGVEETELGDGVTEYALYGAPGELPELPRLEAVAGDALVEVTAQEVGEDWETRWREFHRPVVIDRALTIRPPWEERSQTPIEVVIDPGRAFGTGAHPTTRLCLEMLLELDHHAGSFVDLGCGSGVVAILAGRLGYGPILALDNDPAAIQAARENARRNDVQMEIRRYDLRMDRVLVGETMVANLLGPLLRAWAARLGEGAELPRRLILSGLLLSERLELVDAFAAYGLQEAARRSSGEWMALLLGPAHLPAA